MKDQIIVESTIKLAHGLDLEVVAEGIVTERQYQLLRTFGCDVGQGFWIAKPMPLDMLVDWYRTNAERPIHRGDPAASSRSYADGVSTA